MAATLQESLLAPDVRPQVITDCCTLIDQRVADQSGISGAAVKLAYKTVKSFAPNHIQHMVATLLPRLIEELEPFWADFHAAGGGMFGDYLAKRGDEVSQALLSVTDARAEKSRRPTITKAYRAVRGGAAKQVEAALPQVGDLVVKYAGAV